MRFIRESKVTIISGRNFLSDEIEDENKNNTRYELPKLVITKSEVIPIKKSLFISTALHPTVVFLIWLISIILALAGIHLFEFNKIKPQKKSDIEFVLVDKPAPPKNPNTKYRSDMDSRSGGVNDPKRKVSMPSPPPSKAIKKTPSTKSAQNVVKKTPAQKQIQKVAPQKQQTQQQVINKTSPAKPAPPTVRPSAKPISAPTPITKPVTPFQVKAPQNAPIGKTLSTGPIGGTSSAGDSSKGNLSSSQKSSSTYAPRPSLAPSAGSSGAPLTRGNSPSGTGNIGNPGGGGGTPGIDALREPDFGPYMRELQRRIKLNWDPPKGNESKTVVLLFKIAKDGRLLSCRINRSSGLPSADQAALKAVELTAPFKPLPIDFKGQSIDIQFTFDYRVFGASKY